MALRPISLVRLVVAALLLPSALEVHHIPTSGIGVTAAEPVVTESVTCEEECPLVAPREILRLQDLRSSEREAGLLYLIHLLKPDAATGQPPEYLQAAVREAGGIQQLVKLLNLPEAQLGDAGPALLLSAGTVLHMLMAGSHDNVAAFLSTAGAARGLARLLAAGGPPEHKHAAAGARLLVLLPAASPEFLSTVRREGGIQPLAAKLSEVPPKGSILRAVKTVAAALAMLTRDRERGSYPKMAAAVLNVLAPLLRADTLEQIVLAAQTLTLLCDANSSFCYAASASECIPVAVLWLSPVMGPKANTAALGLLGAMLRDHTTASVVCTVLRKEPKNVSRLVAMILDGSEAERRLAAVRVAGEVLTREGEQGPHWALVEAGVIPALLQTLRGGADDAAALAFNVLRTLPKGEPVRRAASAHRVDSELQRHVRRRLDAG